MRSTLRVAVSSSPIPLLLGLMVALMGALLLAIPVSRTPVEARPGEPAVVEASGALTYTLYLPMVLSRLYDGSVVVTPGSGGTASNGDGSATVQVPAGSVGGSTTLSVASAGVAGPSGLADPGLTVDIQARDASGQSVTTLSQPATIRLSYAKLNLSFIPEASLAIYSRGSDGVWTPLPTTLDTGSRVAEATTTHFSAFGLFGPPLKSGMPMGVAVDAAGNAYWVDMSDLTIRKAAPGAGQSTVYFDLRGTVGSLSFAAGDLNVDPATGTLYFADGDRVWRLGSDLKPTALYTRSFSSDMGGAPGDSVNGLDFDSRGGTLYLATKYAVLEINPTSGARIRSLGAPQGSSVEEVQDVVVDSRGRIFAATTDAARGTVGFSSSFWGNLYYWQDGASAPGWLPVAYGFAGPRGLAADGSGNVYVANLVGEAISVVSGDDPAVTGFIRNVRYPRGIAARAETLVVGAYDSIVTFPRDRRDDADLAAATISPDGSVSGQGGLVTVTTGQHDAIPANNTLRIGGTVIHELTSFVSGTLTYRLPVAFESPAYKPGDPEQPLGPAGTYRFSVGSAAVSSGSLIMPEWGNWRSVAWTVTDTIRTAQNEWLVWRAPFDASSYSIASQDGLFDTWDLTKGRWLAYQFKENGRFTFVVTDAQGRASTRYVEVTRTGPGTVSQRFRIDPAVGGTLYTTGARAEIPAGALPGTTPYTATFLVHKRSNPSRETPTALSYHYSLTFDPEPAGLNRDVVIRLPYDPRDPAAATEAPKAAFYDSALGDFVHLTSTVDAANGYVFLTFPAGVSWAPVTSTETSTLSAARSLAPAVALPPDWSPTAGAAMGQDITAAAGEVMANMWWAFGLANEEVKNRNFVVRYNTRNGTTASYAQKVLDAMTTARSTFRGMGWAAPGDQDKFGSPPAVEVRIVPWVQSLYGAEGATPRLSHIGHWNIYMATSLTDDEIKVTAAHEFFHAVQFENMSFIARTLVAPKWWMEGTATWAESVAFPGIKLYQKHIEGGAGIMRRSFPSGWDGATDIQNYGTAALAFYLEGEYGAGTIKKIFGSMGAATSFESAFKAAVGGDLGAFYKKYARAFWTQSYGPAAGWDLGAETDLLELKAPFHHVSYGDRTMASWLVNAHLKPPTPKEPSPASFTEASGSVARVNWQCDRKYNQWVYVLDAKRTATLATFAPTDDDEAAKVLSPLATYDVRNPLYLLFVNADPEGGCQRTDAILETPTIGSVSPSRIGTNYTPWVSVYGLGLGRFRTTVSVGAVTSPSEANWTENTSFLTARLPVQTAAGTISMQVKHAAGPTSNVVSITVVKSD